MFSFFTIPTTLNFMFFTIGRISKSETLNRCPFSIKFPLIINCDLISSIVKLNCPFVTNINSLTERSLLNHPDAKSCWTEMFVVTVANFPLIFVARFSNFTAFAPNIVIFLTVNVPRAVWDRLKLINPNSKKNGSMSGYSLLLLGLCKKGKFFSKVFLIQLLSVNLHDVEPNKNFKLGLKFFLKFWIMFTWSYKVS